MVLLCLKIWDLFVLKTYLPTKANYVSTWWDIQEKFIKNITTTTFYFKSKESNENDMPAQVFRAVFYSSQQPSQIRPKQLKNDSAVIPPPIFSMICSQFYSAVWRTWLFMSLVCMYVPTYSSITQHGTEHNNSIFM